MWDLPYFNLGNNLYVHTVGGASINQEPTAIAETLAVLISEGALSQLPCTHHHLATVSSAEEFWKDNETLLPNTKKLHIKW